MATLRKSTANGKEISLESAQGNFGTYYQFICGVFGSWTENNRSWAISRYNDHKKMLKGQLSEEDYNKKYKF